MFHNEEANSHKLHIQFKIDKMTNLKEHIIADVELIPHD